MAIVGKEQDPINPETEETALKEVEGYLEAVEKKPEIDQATAQYVTPSQPPTPSPVTDQTGQVVMAPSDQTPPPINLPLTESEVRDGLHHKIIDSLRWLAEFCVYLIKKYPGRVFYSSRNESTP